MDCLLQLKQTWKLLTSLIFILRFSFHFEDIYQPYKKSGDEPLYINKNSNHSPAVIEQILKVISKRISGISSSKEIYDQNISYYKDTLKQSGYDNISLPYNPTLQQGQSKTEKERRKCKIIWFTHLFQWT